jgi:hypothetical protein
MCYAVWIKENIIIMYIIVAITCADVPKKCMKPHEECKDTYKGPCTWTYMTCKMTSRWKAMQSEVVVFWMK